MFYYVKRCPLALAKTHKKTICRFGSIICILFVFMDNHYLGILAYRKVLNKQYFIIIIPLDCGNRVYIVAHRHTRHLHLNTWNPNRCNITINFKCSLSHTYRYIHIHTHISPYICVGVYSFLVAFTELW